jgi:UDP-N-acetylmuramyl tripeptide synthase
MQVNDISITSPYQGFYNAYNILAAVSLAGLAGIEAPAIKKAIASYQPRAGRLEAFTVKGKKAVLVLVKNPTGLNQSLTMLNLDHRLKNIFIALNDNAADGRDISWIWDADLEIVTEQAEQIKWVICSGQRSGDMAVRVKYGGFDPGRIIIQTDLQEAIMQAIDLESEIAYILCTYTALFRCRQILGRLQKKYPSGRLGKNCLPRRPDYMNNFRIAHMYPDLLNLYGDGEICSVSRKE